MSQKNWAKLSYADLDDKQREFLSQVIGNKKSSHFLTGCAGSGKTVMALHAAQMLKEDAKNTNSDYSVRTRVYTKLLAKFISDASEGIMPDLYVEWFHKFKGTGEPPLEHVNMEIIDEFQDFRTSMIKSVEHYSDAQIWLGDPAQQIYQNARDDGGVNILHSKFKDNHTHLGINYRNSVSVASLAKYFIVLNKFDTMTIQEKVSTFMEPIFKNPLQTSEANNHPNILIEARNEEEEYDAIAKIIKGILSGQHDSDRKRHIVVPQFRNKDVDKVDKALKDRGIQTYRAITIKNKEKLPDFSNDHLVLTCTIHSLKGLECDYLIFPRAEEKKIGFFKNQDREILNNLLHVLFTRAQKRIWCSYVDKNDCIVHKTVENSQIDSDGEKWGDWVEHLTASEILSNNHVEKSTEEIKSSLTKEQKIQERIKSHFDQFDDKDDLE